MRNFSQSVILLTSVLYFYQTFIHKQMKKVIAFIPVRCGSKSIPMKNIQLFCGKPLVYWNLLALQNTKEVTEIHVATDCQAIKTVVLGFGMSKVQVFDRSAENANDTASTESVMLEFLAKMNYALNDSFLLVQATSPLTETHHFEEALVQYKNENLDSLLTCVPFKRFFWTKEGTSKNYDYRNRPRRQDFEAELMENGAFYISSVGSIQASKNRLSGKIGVYEMPEHTLVELDEPSDWVVAESLMKKYVLNRSNQPKTIKLFATDVDGVLTDAGMYYSENGDELKKFNTHDGMGLSLLRKSGIKTAIITSENTKIVENRAKKLQVDYLYQGKIHGGKLAAILEICEKEDITLENVAYIGDDINCFEALSNVGLAACPADAEPEILAIPHILKMTKKGGEGCVREFIRTIMTDIH